MPPTLETDTANAAAQVSQPENQFTIKYESKDGADRMKALADYLDLCHKIDYLYRNSPSLPDDLQLLGIIKPPY